MKSQITSQFNLARTPLTLCILAILSLSACTPSNINEQKDKGEKKTTSEANKNMTSYSLVQSEKTKEYLLNYFNQSMIQQVRSNIEYIDREYNNNYGDMSKAATESTYESASDSSSASFSTTNLIEKNVDEVDFVKQDKNYIYLTSPSAPANEQGMDDTDNDGIPDYEQARRIISIYQKPNVKPEEVVGKAFFNRDSTAEGIYIDDESLFNLEDVTSKVDGSHFMRINAFDISNADKPTPITSHTLTGKYKQSRRINDNLYVVMQSHIMPINIDRCKVPPKGNWSKRINSFFGIEDTRISNCQQEQLLTSDTFNEYLQTNLPRDLATGNLININDCYVPQPFINSFVQNNGKGTHGFLNTELTTINKIDLKGGHHQTICVFNSANNFYMSNQAMYFANPQNMSYQSNAQHSQEGINSDMSVSVIASQLSTLIHKFRLASDSNAPNNRPMTYAGVGKVTGEINRDVPSFSMNEYKGVLRIATTGYDMKDGSVKNMLHTLTESDDELVLDTLATLPNQEYPKPIGKPNEHIKGVRFMGDQGYIVTFENADPLYKIDLSNPKNPQMMGELEMSGYSAYLHRISEKYIMGVGYTVNERAIPTGIQTTIFDITSVPKIIAQDTVEIEDRDYQPEFKLMVDNDSKALSTIAIEGKFRVTIPYLVAGGNDFQIEHQDNGYRTMTKALEYEIDQKTGEFVNRYRRNGQMLKTSMYDAPKFRALIHANDLYYVTDDGVINKYEWGKK